MTEVDTVLANYSPDLRPVQIESNVARSVEPLGSAGGMSGAQFWRITAARTAVRGSPDPAQIGTYMLRRWPAEHPSPERLHFIHGVLRHAASRGCEFLPIPVTAQTGQSFVSRAGHLWELAPWMPGAADYEQAPSVQKLQAAMWTLARFHNAVTDLNPSAAPGSAGGSSAITRHFARLRNLTSTTIANLANAISNDTWPDLAPLARQFIAALPSAIPPAIAQLESLANKIFPLQPCLRDIWHDHVLFTGNEVTGLVDFGAIDIDTPATDIARLLGSFASVSPLPCREGQGEGSIAPTIDQRQTWHEGLAAYNTIHPLLPDETRAVHALHASGTILAGVNWIRWIYIDHNTFDDPARITDRFRRILAALASQ